MSSLTILTALALLSCGHPTGVEPRDSGATRVQAPAEAAPQPPPPSSPVPATLPVFELGPEAITYVEGNNWCTIELVVTISNPSDQLIEVATDALVAFGPDGVMGAASWHPNSPTELGPRAQVARRVSWGYASGACRTIPTSATIARRARADRERNRGFSTRAASRRQCRVASADPQNDESRPLVSDRLSWWS